MSPLGRVMLRLCRTDLGINMDLVYPFFRDRISQKKMKAMARTLGLHIIEEKK